MSWLRQTPDKPLFTDLLWSRPENKARAGNLLIIGGNAHGFAAPAASYQAALKAGVGSARVILPSSLQKTVGKILEAGEYAPSTPSGSFSRLALAEMLDLATWSNAVLLAGDFGRNSETAILLESFAAKYSGILVVAGDGLDYFLSKNSALVNRPQTVAVINLGKLQKLAQHNNPATPILYSMNLMQLVEVLSKWTSKTNAQIITKHASNFIVASDGQVSTTPTEKDDLSWQTQSAATAAVWLLQNPTKPFEALTCACLSIL